MAHTGAVLYAIGTEVGWIIFVISRELKKRPARTHTRQRRRLTNTHATRPTRRIRNVVNASSERKRMSRTTQESPKYFEHRSPLRREESTREPERPSERHREEKPSLSLPAHSQNKQLSIKRRKLDQHRNFGRKKPPNSRCAWATLDCLAIFVDQGKNISSHRTISGPNRFHTK